MTTAPHKTFGITKLQTKHILELDGLRGLAAIIVLMFHLSENVPALKMIVPIGHVGVTLFYALSGFLMGHLYLGRSFTVEDTGKYAVARFVRIAPIYLSVVVGSWAFYKFYPNKGFAITDDNLLRHLLFVPNVNVLWSVAPEVQFYAVFVVIWAAVSIYRQKMDPLPLIGLIAILLLSMAYGSLGPGTFVAAHIQSFVLGVVMALIRDRISIALANPRHLIFAQSCLLLIFIMCTNEMLTPFEMDRIYRYHPDARVLIPGALVLLISLSSALSRPLFGNKAMQKVGAWSFALYLLHMPVIWAFEPLHPQLGDTIFLVVVALFSLVVAWLAHTAIERPCQWYLRPKLEYVVAKTIRRRVEDEASTL